MPGLFLGPQLNWTTSNLPSPLSLSSFLFAQVVFSLRKLSSAQARYCAPFTKMLFHADVVLCLIFFLQYRQTLSLGNENVWHWQLTWKCSLGHIICPHGVSLHPHRDPFSIKNSKAIPSIRKFLKSHPNCNDFCSIMNLLYNCILVQPFHSSNSAYEFK